MAAPQASTAKTQRRARPSKKAAQQSGPPRQAGFSSLYYGVMPWSGLFQPVRWIRPGDPSAGYAPLGHPADLHPCPVVYPKREDAEAFVAALLSGGPFPPLPMPKARTSHAK